MSIGVAQEISDPLVMWIPLISALVGGLLAGGGSILGSWLADKRHIREQRAQWDRELKHRYNAERIETYARFVGVVDETINDVLTGVPAPPESIRRARELATEIRALHQKIAMIGSPEIKLRALHMTKRTIRFVRMNSELTLGKSDEQDGQEIRELYHRIARESVDFSFAVSRELGVHNENMEAIRPVDRSD